MSDVDTSKDMIHRLVSRSVAKRTSIVMLAMLTSGAALTAQQTESADHSFIAFRFDDSHVIAVVNVGESNGDLGRKEGISAAPIAQYGFRMSRRPTLSVRRRHL